MIEIEPLRIEVESETDGRFLASVPDLPGVMAYGATSPDAVRKVKSIALQVLADSEGQACLRRAASNRLEFKGNKWVRTASWSGGDGRT